MDPYYENHYSNPEYIKSIISCLAVRANFTLDEAFYRAAEKTLRLHNKYKFVDSCYFSFAGLKFPPSYTRIVNRAAKFDVTVEETDKRPTMLRLVSEYLQKIAALEKEIDQTNANIESSIKKLKKYANIYPNIDTVLSFTDIADILKNKENDISAEVIKKIVEEKDDVKVQSNLQDLEKQLEKDARTGELSDTAEDSLLKKYYVINGKLSNFSNDLTELLNKVDQYLSGVVEQAYKKEFSSNEILMKKDRDILCFKAIVDIPQSCRDIICSEPPRKVKSFSWIVTELEWPKLVKINELKDIFALKSRLDRNDVSILEEFKNSQETLQIRARNIILLRQTKKTLEDQVEKIKSKIAKQKIEKKPVGNILSIDARANKGVINLGRRNGLFNNSIFEVYGVIKGRELVFKGMAKILKLGEENSKILMLPVVNVEDNSFTITRGAGIAYPEFFDVITKEYTKRLPYRNIIKISSIKDLKPEVHDILYSEIFDPSQKKVISFAGNLHLIYTNAEAAKKLSQWNFKFQEKVDINNDYVILGKDYEESGNYKVAKELNIKLLREKDLYDLLELQYKY